MAKAPTSSGKTAPAPSEAANLGAAEHQTAEIAAGHGPDGLRAGDAPLLHADSLAEAAAALSLSADPVPLPNGGPGVGAAQVAERQEGFALRPVGTVLEERLRDVAAPRVPAVTKDVLPRTDYAVDPDSVPGFRYATAANQVRRDGLTRQPGHKVKIDYRGYVELVAIGAILPTPWAQLPKTDEGD